MSNTTFIAVPSLPNRPAREAAQRELVRDLLWAAPRGARAFPVRKHGRFGVRLVCPAA